jgi:putative transposase
LLQASSRAAHASQRYSGSPWLPHSTTVVVNARGVDSNVLPRAFNVTEPNRAWVTDITYILTWQGWLYLAVVMNLFSRKIIGWSMKATISREHRYRCSTNGCTPTSASSNGHSLDSGMPIRERRLEALMSNQSSGAEHEPTRKLLGQCRGGILLWEPQEIADQEANLQEPRDRQAEISDYIESFYNRTRRHTHVGGAIPADFEAAARRPRNRLH